jgi:pimeloyl-ACP methyl ester carboxylesterase
VERELLEVPMLSAVSGDVYSGIARTNALLWCSRVRAEPESRTVAVYCHPSANLLGHYALYATAKAGVDAVGMTTRYSGNDSQVILEHCVTDIGSVVQYLRQELGYERVVLVGNSGGGGLAALYQEQAEHPSIRSAPGGGGPDLTRAVLPPVDALVLLNAHPGRPRLLEEWIDPAVADEANPTRRLRELDLFAPERTVPLARSWVAQYRAAQAARMSRISAWVRGQLEDLATFPGGEVPDLPFVVHGTCADPRFVDTSLDPSDREPGTLWGDAREANFRPVTLGHFCTLRSWLSQWSTEDSHGDGPTRMQSVAVPALVVCSTADQGCFPSMADDLYRASTNPRSKLVTIKGATHYFTGQPALLQEMTEGVADWLRAVA